MTVSTRSELSLLGDIERFLREADMPASKFGRVAMNDSGFVPSLRGGREVSPTVEERCRAFMAGEMEARAPKQRLGRTHAGTSAVSKDAGSSQTPAAASDLALRRAEAERGSAALLRALNRFHDNRFRRIAAGGRG